MDRGGGIREISQLLYATSDNDPFRCTSSNLQAQFAAKFTEIVLVSNGYCGSTCAIFSSIAARHIGKGVTTVVVGGRKATPQQFWSFPGGEVLTLEEINKEGRVWSSDRMNVAAGAEDLYPLGLREEHERAIADLQEVMPRPLPTSAHIRLCIREVYGPQNGPRKNKTNGPQTSSWGY